MKNQLPSFGFIACRTPWYLHVQTHCESSDFTASLAEIQLRSKVKFKSSGMFGNLSLIMTDLRPSLRVDKGPVGNPTHKSSSYRSFQVNSFVDTQWFRLSSKVLAKKGFHG